VSVCEGTAVSIHTGEVQLPSFLTWQCM